MKNRLPFEKTGWKTALGWWVIAGAMGVLLRLQLLHPISFITYPYLLHGHSHVVLLGWTFNALFLAITASFLPPAPSNGYRWAWILFQVAVLGMLVFFPIQGYAAGSIAFSTLHVFVSYYLALRLWADTNKDKSLSARLLGWGLFFLVFSTLGPYALGILKAKQLQETIWYNLAIYFYLHYLYNGWFALGCLALLFRGLERGQLMPPARAANRFLVAIVSSAAGTVALSALWTHPPIWVWVIGVFFGLLQLVAGGWLIGWLWRHRDILAARLLPQSLALGKLALISVALKLIIQALSALPWAAEWAYLQRHLVIAYLHLVFIGVITFVLLAWAVQHQKIQLSNLALTCLVLFFGLTELGLVLESLLQKGGSYLPYFGEIMLVLSMGLWAGVAWLWAKQYHRTAVRRAFSLAFKP